MDSSLPDKPVKGAFKGNKKQLPHKVCKRCGRDMVWRKSWAKNWDQVLYCSDRCRSGRSETGIR